MISIWWFSKLSFKNSRVLFGLWDSSTSYDFPNEVSGYSVRFQRNFLALPILLGPKSSTVNLSMYFRSDSTWPSISWKYQIYRVFQKRGNKKTRPKIKNGVYISFIWAILKTFKNSFFICGLVFLFIHPFFWDTL